MPSKVRDSSSERKRERKESKPEKKEKSKDRRHKSSHARRKSSTKEKSSSRTSLSSSGSHRCSSLPVKVEEEKSSLIEPKPLSAYPPFSKAHSKEAVGSHPSLNLFTPPATDLNASKEKIGSLNRNIQSGPPSPPLTDNNAGRIRPTNAKVASVETITEEEKDEDIPNVNSTNRTKLSTGQDGQARSSAKNETNDDSARSLDDYQNTPSKPNQKRPQRSVSQPVRYSSPLGGSAATEFGAYASSDATSIAPHQPSVQRPGSRVPLDARRDTLQPEVLVVGGTPSTSGNATPFEVFVEDENPSVGTPGGPPPPPPPPNVPVSIPKVDYLLQYGGLNQNIPKNLLYAGKPMAVQQAAVSPQQHPVVVANLFEPYNQLLNDFQKVMSKNGSLAVATGYRSVARRLLDRLETVFARDISSEYCMCSMCKKDNEEMADVRGVSWGEILELVSGRRELPAWPPFAFVATPDGISISLDMQTPMQKLDVDVPEEYRDHYIRQSRKTKQSVDRWLNRQGNDPSSPPEEVDDETLTFAILTHLTSDQRPIFKDLLGIVDKPLEPPRRAPSPDVNLPRPVPTPHPKSAPEHITAASQAIRRLYRLSTLPRDPETANYLLNNPAMHGPLATLAAVSSDEWDILISGRFDGFLRSGAEDEPELTPANGRYTPGYRRRQSGGNAAGHYPHNRSYSNSNPIRPGTAPLPSRGSEASAKYGAPVAFDEETEIATLGEIERDIFAGMDALEDAFEQLHMKAETVRRAIQERSAGLAAAAQRRRSAASIEVRMDTPASMLGEGLRAGLNKWEAEVDDGLGDDISELMPDDSASNISSARRRRKGGTKRRHERMKTPVVPIDEAEEYGIIEEVEQFAGSEGSTSPRKV